MAPWPRPAGLGLPSVAQVPGPPDEGQRRRSLSRRPQAPAARLPGPRASPSASVERVSLGRSGTPLSPRPAREAPTGCCRPRCGERPLPARPGQPRVQWPGARGRVLQGSSAEERVEEGEAGILVHLVPGGREEGPRACRPPGAEGGGTRPVPISTSAGLAALTRFPTRSRRGTAAGERGFVPPGASGPQPSASRLGSRTAALPPPPVPPTSISGSPWLFIGTSATASGQARRHLAPRPMVPSPSTGSPASPALWGSRGWVSVCWQSGPQLGLGSRGGAEGGGLGGGPGTPPDAGQGMESGELFLPLPRPPLGHPEGRPCCCAESTFRLLRRPLLATGCHPPPHPCAPEGPAPGPFPLASPTPWPVGGTPAVCTSPTRTRSGLWALAPHLLPDQTGSGAPFPRTLLPL